MQWQRRTLKRRVAAKNRIVHDAVPSAATNVLRKQFILRKPVDSKISFVHKTVPLSCDYVKRQFCGIINSGNMCWIISTVQAMNNTMIVSKMLDSNYIDIDSFFYISKLLDLFRHL